jgi:hypothetical protein
MRPTTRRSRAVRLGYLDPKVLDLNKPRLPGRPNFVEQLDAGTDGIGA